MARTVKDKELVKIRLAANYGGWMYCDACGENIGYLCYATYDSLRLEYCCKCGSVGRAKIDFEDSACGKDCSDELVLVKNRFCCPRDHSPLITILDKKVENYNLHITCRECSNIYERKK